ncbi:MAG: glycosyltransferase [Nitrososphaerales archaeon]|jgi:cellulose synthase/poly-beta-1,6-N-acetylglucosamine synthase-like glycosyltransferase
MPIQAWFLIEIITLAITVPVLGLEYYWLVLLATSTKYPRDLESRAVMLKDHPLVSVLIASYNEKYVIGRSLEALRQLDYPKERLQIVIADDSNDQTVAIIDEKVRELNEFGITTVVSRRPSREHFKCGALNKAMERVTGEFILLLDADSIVPPDVLNKGIDAMGSHPRASFVSFRYGHYNRNYNLITRLFALYQDIGDTLSKMGAYLIDAPFSFQGGFALVRATDLRGVGQWSNERIADDGDVSIKMYLAGKRGIYLSSVKIMSEDPSTLEAWKKQVARTSQGWWRCIAKYWRNIITAPDINLRTKAGLLLMLLGPFSGFSWILVTFLSAFAVIGGVVQPVNSIFNNPFYIGFVAVPFVISMASGAWALWVQGIMTVRNVILIPMLGYATGAMLSLGSVAFFYGIFDRTGFFAYRTPHGGSGEETTKKSYFHSLANDRNAIVEGVLAVLAILLAVMVFLDGVWFLSLTLVGFGIFTLKSMNLSRHLQPRERARPAPKA